MKARKEASPNNIWNKDDFRWCGAGEKCRLIGIIKYIGKCIRWSRQRIVRGYADCDWWNMDSYLQRLIPDMLREMREHHMGSPAYLGEEYINKDGMAVNDTCHEEWNIMLDRMIFLWREADENTCTRKNPYEDEYDRAIDEFHEKYGLLGEKLLTESEQEENRRGDYIKVHTMSEVAEYKAITDKYFEEMRNIDEYRSKCKDEALDLLKEHFYSLWD